MLFNRIRSAALISSLFAACGCGGTVSSPSQPVTLTGAGSTFGAPFFSKASARYFQSTGVRVSYRSVASSSGIHEFTAGRVDFGATLIPMNARELAAFPGGATGVVQVPITLGGVVIAYNVPGLTDAYVPHREHLRLTPDLLGKIFSGSITTWNDPEIAALNPSARLPSLSIAVVNQADASSTTSMFVDYLNDSSPSWSAYVRKNGTTAWHSALSLGSFGKNDVAAQMRKTNGSIGYVDMATVIGTRTNYAAIRNQAGNFLLPSMLTVRTAAAQRAVTPTDHYIDDVGAADAYPIAGYSWLLIRRNQSNAANGAAMCAFVRWMLTDGQKVAPSIGNVPLPTNVAKAALADLGQCTSGP